MADMRTLTVEGTTYNIKDATARADITTLQTNVTQLQTNVTQLQTNVTQLQTNVTQLQENTADLPQIRENVENNADDIRALNTAVAKYQIYDTASGSIASFPDGADDEPIKELIVNVDPVQSGSGDPSPDNVRPISGWTGAKVTRARANLLPHFVSIPSQSGLTFDVNENGKVTINGTASSIVVVNAPAGEFKWNGIQDLWLSGCPAGGDYQSGYSLRVRTAAAAGTTGFSKPDIGNGIRLSSYSSANKIENERLYYTITIREGTVCNNLVFAPMLNVGLSAQPYEPYKGETYNITFPTEAGTVYGGTLTVNADGTGKLLVQFNKHTPTSFNGSLGTSTDAYIAYVYIATSNHNVPLELHKNIKSNKFKYNNTSTNRFALYDFGGTSGSTNIWSFALPLTITSTAEANTWLENNPIEFTYQLTNPIEYTLTAQQVINTLLGQNNIWADTGDVSVTYPADLKLYIDKKVAQ